jgi:hypothetical protein
MNCEQTRESLSAHIDNELPAAEAAAVAAHLSACPACAAELGALKGASRFVRDLPLKPLPAGFMARLQARRAGGAAAPAASLSSWFGPRPLAFAAAVVVVALVIAGPWRSLRLARAPGAPLAETAGASSDQIAPQGFKDVARAKVLQAPAPSPAAAPAAPAPRQEASPAGAAFDGAIAKSAKKAEAFGSMSAGAERGAALEMPERQDKALAGGGGGTSAAGLAAGAPSGSPAPYSNEELHDVLQRESDAAGYKGAARAEPEPDSDTSFMGRRLGAPGSREQSDDAIRQLQELRKNVDENSGKAAQVPIAGTVAPVLSGAQDSRGGQALDAEQPLADGFWSGDYAAGNDGSRTVEDAQTWTALWRTLSTAPAPAVDFKRSMVVAVFLGPRPTGGYSVEFAETKRLARSLMIRWRERAPEPGMSPPDGATSPYALKVMPRSDVPVRFEKTR